MIHYLDKDELKDRLEELEDLERAVQDAQTDVSDRHDEGMDASEEEGILNEANSAFGDEERAELKRIRDFIDEVGGDAWRDEEFIEEDSFKEYAQDFAEEIGATKLYLSWPYTCIDWEQAARELRMDYSSVDYDGRSYLYRS